MKMKAKKQLLQLLSLIITAVAFTACQDDMVPDLESGPGRLKISNDALVLSERVDYKRETVSVLPIGDISSVRSTAAGQNFENEGYTLVAEIQTPVINGEKTSATHIKIIGDKAYITYHINGSVYGGGFDIIDLSSSDNILVTGSAQFNDTDFNALDIDITNGETFAYLAGANGKGAYVEKIRIDNGLIVDDTDSLQLEGFNANGIAVSKHQLYVTVGGSSNSGYYAIDIRNANKMWQINEQKNAIYAKDVALVSADLNSQLAFLSAGSGTIDVSQVTSKGLGNFRNIQAEEINTKDGKNTIALDGQYIYAAMGDQGFQIYHEVFHSYLFKIPTSQMGGGLTNGVSVDDENIYIANGSGGVYIAKKPNGTSFELTGLLNMAGSANYVASSNDYLLVANGTGGIKVLHKDNNESEINACIDGDNWVVNTNGSFTVKNDEVLIKTGSVSFKNDLTVQGELYQCGTLQVGTNLNIQNGGKLDAAGTLVVTRDLSLNNNSTLVIEGSVVVYGNFNFGGKIIFEGQGSSLQVFGNVNNNGGSYEGTYTGTPLK